ncbi:MAG: hypothetical protein HYY26_02080 [Acidobacteria bacterium]|nr:hypothetical protein [Acidobacteriota bacterium]
MRKLFTTAVLIALVAMAAASPLRAEAHKFELTRTASLNGIELSPGSYKLKLNGEGEALIYRGKELVVKSRVEVKPLARGSASASVLQAADGSLREIRLNKKVVVFVR